MIILADFIRDFERDAFRREDAFVTSRMGEGALCVAPADQGCSGDYAATILYQDGLFYEKSLFPALLRHRISGQPAELRTSLSNAMFHVVTLADDPSLLSRLDPVGLDADDEAVLAALGIAPDPACRSHVAAWEEGPHLAPHDGGYAYFFVDTHGPTQIVSWSERLAPVALHFAADLAAEASNLSGRIAKLGG